ncbi:uncharacterized protein LOC135502227 [Lineus longissimus]|uniref:uncharacterized protein LOC135502227 n=1 Tax=Lineus longissimus TaxID=88925 RepID=UPI00315D742D
MVPCFFRLSKSQMLGPASESLQIKTTTASNSKEEKETETFTCEAIADITVTSVKLIRQNGTTNETLIEANSSVVTFRRQMMRQDNKVKFYCEATWPGIPNSLSSNVITYSVSFPHNVQVKISKTTVTEHEFVRFECIISGGNPEFVTRYQWLWKKSGSTEEQVMQDTKTGKLFQFARIPYYQSGTYSCKAWNDGGVGQSSTDLSVQYSPRIDPEAKMKYDVAAEIGREAMFELFIVANPTPTTTGYTWSKDGNVLSRTSPDYEITSGPTSSELKIKDVKSLDYTNYSCSVKTSAFEAKIFNFMLIKAASNTSDLSNSVSVNTTVAIYFGVGLIGAVILMTTVVLLAVARWKRRLKKKLSKKFDRPANDSNDDAARNELTPIKKRPDHTYANIDPDFFNDTSSRSKRTTDKYPAKPMVKRPPVSVRFGEDKEPACSEDILDVDLYDYVDNEWQSNASGSDYSSVPACRTSQVTSPQVASALINVHVHQTNQPDEDGQQSLYEHLKPVSKNDYLDFTELSAEELRPRVLFKV